MTNEKRDFNKWFVKGLQALQEEKYICANLYKDEDDYSCELVGADKIVKDSGSWNFDEKKVYDRQTPYLLCKSDYSEDRVLKFFKKIMNILLSKKEIQTLLKNKVFMYGFIDGKLYFPNLSDENEIF